MAMIDDDKKPLAVVKVGGDILLDEDQRTGLANNINDLIDHGWQVIILHGGGPQTSQLQNNLGVTPKKIEGRRVTDIAALTVVKQAIAGEVNVNLVSLLVSNGINAFGCHGASGKLISAKKRPPMLLSDHKTKVDFGEVGDVVSINTLLLNYLLDLNIVPVIATLGIDDKGTIFNINADTTVVKITESIGADLLLLVTGVGGIYYDIDDKNTRIPEINQLIAKKLIDEKIIHSGMIPKVNEALRLINQGTKSIVILSASDNGAFLDAANKTNRFGTSLTI